jgi:hypothetical protein
MRDVTQNQTHMMSNATGSAGIWSAYKSDAS